MHPSLFARLRQRRLQVLGRSVDVHLLVTESINAILRKTLDGVIGLFEASRHSWACCWFLKAHARVYLQIQQFFTW